MSYFNIIDDKLEILIKLNQLKKIGIMPSQNYNLNSDYNLMSQEYNRLLQEIYINNNIESQSYNFKEKDNSIIYINI